MPSEDEIEKAGAGDQGMMFGYATNETESLMPMPIHLAHRMAERLAEVRHDGTLPYLRPDGKTQVTVRYVDSRPVSVERVLISTQHLEEVDSQETIKPDLFEHGSHPRSRRGSSTRTRSGRACSSTRPASSSSAARWATPA